MKFWALKDRRINSGINKEISSDSVGPRIQRIIEECNEDIFFAVSITLLFIIDLIFTLIS